MAKQTFTTGQVLTAAQMTSLQQTAMGGGSATAKTASYVLVAADAGTTVIMNAAGATTITVNTSLFAAGDTVLIQNIGAGTCTVTAGTATVSTSGSLALTQYEAGILYFTAAGAAIFYDYTQTPGSTLLATSTFTTASEVIFDSVFSSTYNNYILVFNITAATATAYVNCNFRTGGSNITTTNYGFSGGTASTASGAVTSEIASTGQGGSLISRTNTVGNGYASGTVNFYNPFASQYTFADAFSISATGTTGAFSNYRISTSFTATNSFDGFRFNPGSGTITGIAKIYGLTN